MCEYFILRVENVRMPASLRTKGRTGLGISIVGNISRRNENVAHNRRKTHSGLKRIEKNERKPFCLVFFFFMRHTQRFCAGDERRSSNYLRKGFKLSNSMGKRRVIACTPRRRTKVNAKSSAVHLCSGCH